MKIVRNILLSYHPVSMSSYHNVTISSWHPIMMSSWHHGIISSYAEIPFQILTQALKRVGTLNRICCQNIPFSLVKVLVGGKIHEMISSQTEFLKCSLLVSFKLIMSATILFFFFFMFSFLDSTLVRLYVTSYIRSLHNTTEWTKKLVTFETFDQSEEISTYQHTFLSTSIWEHP